jgi:hypothetical protein
MVGRRISNSGRADGVTGGPDKMGCRQLPLFDQSFEEGLGKDKEMPHFVRGEESFLYLLFFFVNFLFQESKIQKHS